VVGKAPPESVVRAFGVNVKPIALSGGEGLSYRAGPVVFKRVHDVLEAAWIQELLQRIDADGIRVAAPVPASDGTWIVDSWAASEFIAGLQPVAPRWDLIIEWGLRFGEAADRVLPTDRSLLDDRSHRWATADRVAWGETTVELSADAVAVQDELTVLLLDVPSRQRGFVHGDLAGNVFVDPTGCPVVLDVSPYLRDPRWAAAIVVGDAALWHGADPALAREFVAATGERDLLGRALIFRLIAEQLAVDPRHGAKLEPYRRLIQRL
jgi:uncharacterized protein (TIGR02569 family)